MAGISHEFVDYLAGCWLIWNESGCDVWDALVLYDTFFVYDVFIFSTGLAWTMFFFFFGDGRGSREQEETHTAS